MMKMTNGVKFLLNREKVSLKEAINRKWVRKNRKGIYVLTGKGNKVKQNVSSLR